MRNAILINTETYDFEHLETPLDPEAFHGWAAARLDSRAIEVGAILPNGDHLYVDPEARWSSKHYFLHRNVGLPLPGSALLVPSSGSASLESARDRVIFMDCYDAMDVLAEWTPKSNVIPFKAAA